MYVLFVFYVSCVNIGIEERKKGKEGRKKGKVNNEVRVELESC